MMKLNKWMLMLTAAAGLGMATLSAAEALPEEEQPAVNWSKAGRFALLYVPNLLQDAADIISLQVGVGSTFSCNFYATHFAEFGWENTDSFFIGKGNKQQWGGGRREAVRLALGCLGMDDVYVSHTFGWAHPYVLQDQAFNFPEHNASAYRDGDVDFWAIGARAGLLFDVVVECHPVGLADFLCGIVGYDLSSDNWE